MIERGDTTRPEIDSSDPSEAVKELEKKRSTQNVVFLRFKKSNQALHNCTVSSLNSKNKFGEFMCDQQILTLSR